MHIGFALPNDVMYLAQFFLPYSLQGSEDFQECIFCALKRERRTLSKFALMRKVYLQVFNFNENYLLFRGYFRWWSSNNTENMISMTSLSLSKSKIYVSKTKSNSQEVLFQFNLHHKHTSYKRKNGFKKHETFGVHFYISEGVNFAKFY